MPTALRKPRRPKNLSYDVKEQIEKLKATGVNESDEKAIAAVKKLAEATGVGMRFSGGKPRMDLIPADALIELGALYELGVRKYGVRNWEKGMPFGECFAPLLRHALLWWLGETHDKKDGQHHMIAVAWNAFALFTLERTHPEFDDRPLKKPKTKRRKK